MFVGLAGVFLVVILSLEPAPNGGLAPIFKINQTAFWQGENRFILDDLEVTFIALFLCLFIPATNRLYTTLYRRMDAWGHYHFRTIRIQKLDLLNGHRSPPR